MNPDQLAPRERSASTSNRNFEGRQGKGGRTHLVSPAGRRRHRGRAARLTLARPTSSRQRGAIAMEKFTVAHRRRRPAAPQQRRHRPDHPGASTSSGSPAPASRTGCSPPGAATPTFVLNQPAVRRRRRSWSPGRTSAPAPPASTRSGRCRTTASGSSSRSRFADIFRGNCGKAGLLTAVVEQDVVEELWAAIEADPGTAVTVDLEAATVTLRRAGRRRSRSTTTPAGGCSRASTTSASPSKVLNSSQISRPTARRSRRAPRSLTPTRGGGPRDTNQSGRTVNRRVSAKGCE